MIEVEDIEDRLDVIDGELEKNQEIVNKIDKNLDKMDSKINKLND